MPHSYKNCLNEIKRYVSDNLPKDAAILDIGTGAGSWFDIFNEMGYSNIDGIEVYEPYVSEFGLKAKYKNLYICNALDFKTENKYDFVFIGDMLEHLTVADAQKLIKNIMQFSKSIMIVIPYHLPQVVKEGNILETHLQPDITPELFKSRYPEFTCISEKENLGITQGVWIWHKKKVNISKKIKYTVVIPERNEAANFKLTAENIRATQKNCEEIKHIEDTNGLGTSFSRHSGIMQSDSEIIITCDAHMRFLPDALDNMAKYISNSDRDVLCCLKCHHNPTMDFNQPGYSGADILWKQEEPGMNRILSAVWRHESTPGEIAAVMGACYGFKKSSYLKIGSPWNFGVAWGNDEETISIPFRLIGGSVELLDYHCAHLYNTQSNYGTLPNDIPGVWYNRIRNLHYLPLNVKRVAELQEYILANPDASRNRDKILNLLNLKMPLIKTTKAVLMKNQVISFDDYAAKWVKGYSNQQMGIPLAIKAVTGKHARVTNLLHYPVIVAGIEIKPNESVNIEKIALNAEIASRKSLINLVLYNQLKIED